MKKNILLKIFMIGVFVLMLAVLIYEIFITENFSSQIVTKCFKILVLYGLALCGVSVNGRQRAYERSDQFYADTYKDTIKDAFSNDKRGRKRLILAIRYFNADNPRRADRILLRLKNRCVTPDDFSAVLFFQALCSEEEMLYNKAISEYEELLRYSGADSTAWSNLGLLYERQGRSMDAEKAYSNAIMFDSNNACAHNNLGLFYFHQGNYDKAIENYETASKIDHTLAEPFSGLALCYASRGDQQKAEEYVRLYANAGGDTDSLRAALQNISTKAPVI